MEKSKFYLALGLGVLAFSIIWIALVFLTIEGDIGTYANTPRTVPFFLGCCMAILGFVFLYQAKLGFKPKDAIQAIFDNEFKNITICVIFFLVYAFFLELFGFLISTPVAIFLLTRFVLNEKGWKINFLFPVCMTGTIYVVFIILLNSNLPKGTLF
jgi:energy-converting hydrogenase Eha subunit E